MAGVSKEAILIVKYLKDDMSKAERVELDEWLNGSPMNKRSFEIITDANRIMAGLRLLAGVRVDVIEEKIRAGLILSAGSRPRKSFVRRLLPYAAAAVVAGILVAGVYNLNPVRKKGSGIEVLAVAPPSRGNMEEYRGSYPLLRLPDGSELRLDTIRNGSVIAGTGGIRKSADAEIAFSERVVAGGQYFSLFVPSGVAYGVRLAEGSKVMLDARSSLEIPADLTKNDRSVVLTGHGYFDIVPDRQHPFRIKSPHQEVEVLGTVLDILDHPRVDQQQTVLIDGKARVYNGSDTVLLRPGQRVSMLDGRSLVRMLDLRQLEAVTAWKIGYFNFDDMDIRSAAFRLGQWYGKEVIFSKDLATNSLGSGNFQRNLPLPVLLKDLESKNLHFDIKGDTIVVKK